MREIKSGEVKSVTQQELKSLHGFTPKLIRALGLPDELVRNPHWKAGPKMKLYRLDRVEKFKLDNPDMVEKAAGRRASAQKGVETRWQTLQDELEEVELKFTRKLPEKYAELEKIALAIARGEHGYDALNPGQNGIAAAVRHHYTNYDEIRTVLKGKVGTSDEWEFLRLRVDSMVENELLERYPSDWKRRELPTPISRNRRGAF